MCAIYHGQTSSQNIHSFSKNVKNRSSYGWELEHFSNDRSVFEFPPCFGFGSKYLRPSFFRNSCFKWFLALPCAICLEFLLFFSFLADCQGKFNMANLRSDNTDTFNNNSGHLLLFSSYLMFDIFSRDVAKLKLTFNKFIRRSYFYYDIKIYNNIKFFQYIIKA